MAYNPFNIFRRNQKALFAVLTVFVMVVFTLSSGVAGGDFFETFSRWLGAKGPGAKEAVCKIDGDKVTVGDLEGGPRSLQFRRVMANRYMYHGARQTSETLKEQASQQRERLSESGKFMADSARRALNGLELLDNPQFRNNPQLMPFYLQTMQQVEDADRLIDLTIDLPNAKSDDKEVARIYRTVFNLRRQLTSEAREDREHYFINAPNRTRRDLVEFMLWQKKAEQLGINYSKDDAKQLIQKEFNNSFKNDVEVRKALQQTQGFTMDACLEALAEEFKVRAAQTALLGYGGRYHRAPAYPTPYETFEYYREQCSPAVYEVIPVPAAAYVDKVTGEPADAEIKELYEKYANDEPNPKSETPGFKEPRKISVAWLGVTGEEPYYKKLAEEQLKVGEVMAKASGALTVPLPGGVESWVLGAAARLSLKEPAVDAAYNARAEQFKSQVWLKYSRNQIDVSDILDSSVVKPGVLAATLGGFVGQTAGFGNPAAAASVAVTAPIAYEIRDRVKVGMPLMLGLTPGPAMLPGVVGGAAAGQANEPKPLPIDFLRPELIKDAIAARAKAIAFGPEQFAFRPNQPEEKGDVERFIEELKKLSPDGKPKDKAAVEKYIQDFITSRGLPKDQVGMSTAPRDEWTLEDDPGLQPLVAAQKESLRPAAQFHGGTYMPFGQSFFSRPAPGGRRAATTELYWAEKYPPTARDDRTSGKPHYVVWRTEDVASKKTNLITARDAVKAAWKRLKAREIALREANQLADAIRAYDKTDPLLVGMFLTEQAGNRQAVIADPKVRLRAKKFQIDGVCPLVIATDPFLLMQGRELQPFMMRESENLPYPTLEMRAALLDNRDKPPKTALVLADAPKDTFYVATLTRRDLKSPDNFKNDVYSRAGRARDVQGMHYNDAANKARQSVVDLLKQEFKYEETEEQKKKLDESVKRGGD